MNSSSSSYDMLNMGASSKVLYQSMAGKLLPLLRKHQLLSGNPSAAADSRTQDVTRDALSAFNSTVKQLDYIYVEHVAKPTDEKNVGIVVPLEPIVHPTVNYSTAQIDYGSITVPQLLSTMLKDEQTKLLYSLSVEMCEKSQSFNVQDLQQLEEQITQHNSSLEDILESMTVQLAEVKNKSNKRQRTQ